MSQKFKPMKRIFNQQGEETFAHLHNEKPVSRRDFLSTGLLGFAATMTLPTVYDIVMQHKLAMAQGLDCAKSVSSGMAPLITLNLSGGAALSANWVPMDQGLQRLASYNKMGLGAAGGFNLEYLMGAPFAQDVSGILAGIKTGVGMNDDGTMMGGGVPATDLASFVGVAVRSRDDSDVNKFDISGLATKAGYSGAILPNVGSRPTATGNKNSYSFIKPPTPLSVNRFADLEGALGLSGSLAALTDPQKMSLFKTVDRLNSNQARKLASVTGAQELSQLVQCAAKDNVKIAGLDRSKISPLVNTSFADVWGLNAASQQSSRDFVFASMVYNGLMGHAGVVNLEMGGYDYHNGTRTTGDTKDTEAGVVIGRILRSAQILGKRLFLVVTSDGAVVSAVSQNSNSPWMSDRGTAGSAYMMAFDPSRKPTASGYQLGHYNQGQGADERFITGSSPELAAAGIFANYMSFNQQASNIERVIPRIFSTDQLNQIIKIHGT